MDELNDEETEAAQKVGLDVHAYRDMAAGIAAGAPQKAKALDMTEEEYEAYAWSLVAEAKKRGMTTEDRVEGVSDEELAAGLKELEEHRASGGPWSDDGKPAPWEEELKAQSLPSVE